MSYTASTSLVAFEELVEEESDFPDKAHKACLVAVAGASVGFVVATVCADRSVEVVTFHRDSFGIIVTTITRVKSKSVLCTSRIYNGKIITVSQLADICFICNL